MHTFADMKREVYESQKAFAGEKKPSMQRRCVGHDYTGRMIYMVTMVVEGRRPLFGTIAGLLPRPAAAPRSLGPSQRAPLHPSRPMPGAQ